MKYASSSTDQQKQAAGSQTFTGHTTHPPYLCSASSCSACIVLPVACCCRFACCLRLPLASASAPPVASASPAVSPVTPDRVSEVLVTVEPSTLVLALGGDLLVARAVASMVLRTWDTGHSMCDGG